MRQSPRIRRLRTDLKALETLKADSTILEFEARGKPPGEYLVRFLGKGFARDSGNSHVVVRDVHEVAGKAFHDDIGRPHANPGLT